MNLLESLSDRILSLIKQKIGSKEEILLAVCLDIDNNGLYAEGWTVVTNNYFLTIYDYGGLVVDRVYEIKKMSDFEVKNNIGNLQLEAKISGETVVLTRFTVSLRSTYLAARQYLNRIADGRERGQLPKVEERTCPDCGRVYPDESKICPSCLNKWRVLKRLIRIMKPHFKIFLVATAIFWLLAGISLINPILQRILVDDVLQSPDGTSKQLIIIILLMGVLSLLSMVLNIIRGRLMTLLSSKLDLDLKKDIYNKIQELSLGYLAQRKVGDLMNRVMGDTRSIQRFIQHHASNVINQLLTIVGVLLILITTRWQLAVMVVLPIPVVILINSLSFKHIRKMYWKQYKIWDQANSLLQDILNGIRVVKAYGKEKHEVERFTTASKKLRDRTIRNEKMWNTIFPSLGFLVGIGNFLIYYLGGYYVLGQQIKPGELIQFISYAGMLYNPLMYLSNVPRWFNEAVTSAERIFDIIDREMVVKDREEPVHMGKIGGEICIKNVTFAYEKHEPILKNINLDVKPGEMIGLVGHSGAGKTTLINLICRFYDVNEGEILIDGVNVKDISQKELRSHIGVVLQESFLFNDTIWANIAYAKPDAGLEEIIRAAKLANAHEFIIKFPDGYDTIVGEKGQRLSGGERQRISIARALLHNPRILILDEPTSSVDTETEQKIQEALERLMKDRTSFAIAHRLATLRNATRLVVIEEGEVVEIGTHEELMRKKGIYFDLVMAQWEMHKSKAVGG